MVGLSREKERERGKEREMEGGGGGEQMGNKHYLYVDVF